MVAQGEGWRKGRAARLPQHAPLVRPCASPCWSARRYAGCTPRTLQRREDQARLRDGLHDAAARPLVASVHAGVSDVFTRRLFLLDEPWGYSPVRPCVRPTWTPRRAHRIEPRSYRPRPHARTRSFQMARSGPGDAARNPVVRRLRAATRSRFASDAHPARHCDTPTMRTWEMRRHTSSIASVHAVSIPNGVTGDERCGPCPTWIQAGPWGESRGAIQPVALSHFCSGISPDYTASSGLRWRIVKEGLR